MKLKTGITYYFVSPVPSECLDNSQWALEGCLPIMSSYPVSPPVKRVLITPSCEAQRDSALAQSSEGKYKLEAWFEPCLPTIVWYSFQDTCAFSPAIELIYTLSTSPCFNTLKFMYKNVMEGLCPSPLPYHVCTFFLALSQTISIPTWVLSINPVWLHCNLESLQEPDIIEPMHELTPTSTHTTIPHLYWQFLLSQTIADWGSTYGEGAMERHNRDTDMLHIT